MSGLTVLARELRRLRLMLDAICADRIATPESMKDPKADVLVRFDPKSWRGPSHKGRKMSECPPEFLDQLAEALATMAKKEDAEQKTYKGGPASRFTRRDAARARRWALEIRLMQEFPEEPAAADAEAPARVQAEPPAAPSEWDDGDEGVGGDAQDDGGTGW